MTYTENEVKAITGILRNKIFHIDTVNGRGLSRIDDSLNSLKYQISFHGGKVFTLSVVLNDSGIHLSFEGTTIKDYEFLANFFNSTAVNFKNQKGKILAYFRIAQKLRKED